MKLNYSEVFFIVMKRYLLGTNAFFELICLAGKNVRRDEYKYDDVMNGTCFISKITELEIISVIGKYGRGEPNQWQHCNRLLSEDGIQKCTHMYFHKGQKPWKMKLCRDMIKLVKEILDGRSPLLRVNALDIDTDIINKANGFMMHSFKHNFGSQDAIIAATAIVYSNESDIMEVVTSDRGLRAAMKREGVCFLVPGTVN